MLLEPGSELLVCHRRLFAEDQLRFFVGVVEATDHTLAKVTGFSWTRDAARGFARKDDRRTKILSLTSGSVILYELPAKVLIEDIHIEQPGGHAVHMTDGAKFRMGLSEKQTPAPGHPR